MERSQDDVTKQKGDMKDINNYRPVSHTFPHVQTVHMDTTKRMEKVLDETQPREQAGSRNGYSTVDHLPQLIN